MRRAISLTGSFILVLGAGLAFASCSPDSGVTEGNTIEGQSGGSGGAPPGSTDGGTGLPQGGQGFGGGFGTSGSGGAGGGSGGGNGGDPDAGCASTSQSAEQVPANLLFVIDRSGSMNCNLPEDVNQTASDCDAFPQKVDASLPSKWEVTRDALITALDDLEALGNVSVGVTMFPTDNSCGVHIDGSGGPTGPDVPIATLDATHKGALTTFLQGVTPDGSTPIVGETIMSYQWLVNTFSSTLSTVNTFVVVVTDGSEQCATPQQVSSLLNTQTPNALDVNIRTFVIGAPGSEAARDMLSRFALQGGTASDPACEGSGSVPLPGNECHFDMTTTTDFQADFAAALATISQAKEISCEFDVPDPDQVEFDPEKVNVSFTPGGASEERVLKDDTAGCEDGAEGWQYNDDQSKIVLCGDICNRVQADRTGAVDIVLGCPTEEVKFQ